LLFLPAAAALGRALGHGGVLSRVRALLLLHG
jgi:hypothetical protein